MNIWIMIPVVLTVTVFVLLIVRLSRHRSTRRMNHENNRLFLNEKAAAASTGRTDGEAGGMFEKVWWKNLGMPDQLQLALHLAERALPVWEKYTALQEATYRSTTTGPSIIIESSLLKRTVEEIILYAQLPTSGSDSIKINRYYQRFVGPVLALQDGMWVCSYPVKKIFFSVYFILMSVVEQQNLTANESFLTEAINAALDCMELSKLYTREEIASFLAAYQYKL